MKQLPDQCYLHVVYAEDVRMEKSGTYSIVGIYPGGLRAAKFPLTIPKLAVAATLVCSQSEVFKSLTLEILFGDKVIHRVNPPEDFVVQSLNMSKDRARKVSGNINLEVLMTFVASKIDGPGIIKTRAIIDSDLVVEGNCLLVEEYQEEDIS